MILAFIAGMIFGSVIGVTIIAIVSVSREDRE